VYPRTSSDKFTLNTIDVKRIKTKQDQAAQNQNWDPRSRDQNRDKQWQEKVTTCTTT